MNHQELKEAIKKIMLDHLTPLGYPNTPLELILSELKPMWIKLEESNLLQPGMNFNDFSQQANHQFIISLFKEGFNG